jgi:hypothetical protein
MARARAEMDEWNAHIAQPFEDRARVGQDELR